MTSVRPDPRVLAGLMVAATVLAAGCSTASGAGGRHQPVVLVERDGSNGKTVHVQAGDKITLILASDYWTIRGSSAPGVLRQDGATKILAPPHPCQAGEGCRPVQTKFTALHPGTAAITAYRRVCGEALRCAGSQRRFHLTVVVSRN